MNIADKFKALSDPARVKILQLLRRRPASVGALVAKVGLSQPAVSHHLRVLREAGFVTVKKKGTKVFYAADRAALLGMCKCLRVEIAPE